MFDRKLSSAARSAAYCAGALMLCSSASAMGDHSAYDQAKASARSTFEADRKACDSLSGNGKDVCLAEARAKRARTVGSAEAAWKDTPKAREHAAHEVAVADYKVARERCAAKAGNDKDVCLAQAKAARVKVQADARAMRSGAEAHIDASKDKREAEYKVAAQRCDAFAGDAKSHCVADARAQYSQ